MNSVSVRTQFQFLVLVRTRCVYTLIDFFGVGFLSFMSKTGPEGACLNIGCRAEYKTRSAELNANINCVVSFMRKTGPEGACLNIGCRAEKTRSAELNANINCYC